MPGTGGFGSQGAVRTCCRDPVSAKLLDLVEADLASGRRASGPAVRRIRTVPRGGSIQSSRTSPAGERVNRGAATGEAGERETADAMTPDEA